MKQKVFSDAGVITPPDLLLKEINDQGGTYTAVPRSSYAIHESRTLAFTNKIVEQTGRRLNIADGDRRPGTV